MNNKQTIKDIEKELTDLYPKKELAYQDYRDNSGSNDDELRNRLWGDFKVYRDQWNKLVDESREKIMNIEALIYAIARLSVSITITLILLGILKCIFKKADGVR
ncbi:hypothetical protein LCGC14_1194870 [marine sediment metagenome]|uniref:Uncharacterized protein n=1 Tax=marine sediment metagenome TaxID=412755 RepID=A0A0F9P140_9ZZZZ